MAFNQPQMGDLEISEGVTRPGEKVNVECEGWGKQYSYFTYYLVQFIYNLFLRIDLAHCEFFNSVIKPS